VEKEARKESCMDLGKAYYSRIAKASFTPWLTPENMHESLELPHL